MGHPGVKIVRSGVLLRSKGHGLYGRRVSEDDNHHKFEVISIIIIKIIVVVGSSRKEQTTTITITYNGNSR